MHDHIEMSGELVKAYLFRPNAFMSLVANGIGGTLVKWSRVLLLRKPDGKFGEPESFVCAFLFWLAGFMNVIYSSQWFR